jgi:cytoskeletal protein CcmA (bactofilin family)
MFGGKGKGVRPQSKIDCLIGAGTKVDGNITFSGGLRVDGEVHGNIVVEKDQPGTLIVSEHARIEGEVVVSHLVANGTIVGPVKVLDTLELQSCARVTGDVEYMQLEMLPGAVVQGRLIHHAENKAVELKLAATRAG